MYSIKNQSKLITAIVALGLAYGTDSIAKQSILSNNVDLVKFKVHLIRQYVQINQAKIGSNSSLNKLITTDDYEKVDAEWGQSYFCKSTGFSDGFGQGCGMG